MRSAGPYPCSTDLGAEEPASAARRYGPGLDVLGVAPHEVAEGALVRYLTHPLYRPHLRTPCTTSTSAKHQAPVS